MRKPANPDGDRADGSRCPWPVRRALLSVRRAMNGQYGTLAGPVVLAVASELVISHATGPGSTRLSLLLFGGPSLT